MYTRANVRGDQYNGTGAWSVYGGDAPVIDISNFSINELTEPQQIHTAQQATYLAYQGDYSTMNPDDYPNGDQPLSDSLPVTVTFDYNVPSGKSLSKYSVVYGKEADLSDGYEKVGNTNKSIDIVNPYLGRNYYKLIANFSDGTKEESAIHRFDVDGTAPRNLAISGMTNCRDIGGRVTEDGGRIKQGLVFRTSGKNQNGSLTEDSKKEMIDHLGFKTEINIADSTSYNVGGSGYFTSIYTLNLFMDYGGSASHHFSRNTESLKNFFEAVADSNNYPIFFHCRIGTDRTGLCAITLAGLLGVPINQIYQDYLFSNFGKIGGKRYIGEQAGQDNIQNYMNDINNFSGTTFKNKVYNALLSIGLSRETLDTVINNLTEGTPAQNNNAGQVIAPANVLSGSGVSRKTDNSDRNHPDYYYTLNSSSQAVSYTFTAPKAYRGQVVAYLGNSNHSTSDYIDNALSLQIDDDILSIRHVSYADAGMGVCGSRMNYYPVILATANISARTHTISLVGTSNEMNVGGIYIFDAAINAADLGGGDVIGSNHVHDFSDEGTVVLAPTHNSTGILRHTCSCGEYFDEVIEAIPHEYDDGVVIAEPTHSSTGIRRHTCSCGAIYDEEIPTIPYSWVSTGSATSGTGTNYEMFNCSDCSAKKIEVVAESGTFASGSSNKTGTPSGFIKLSSNGNSISYTFNYSGTATTARLYQRAIMDSWGSSYNKSAKYSTNATSPSGCNFSLTFNNSLVDMTDTKNIEYQEFLNGGVDTGLGSSYSPMADCLIGTVQLVNGNNTFTYTRLASMNLSVHDYVIIID